MWAEVIETFLQFIVHYPDAQAILVDWTRYWTWKRPVTPPAMAYQGQKWDREMVKFALAIKSIAYIYAGELTLARARSLSLYVAVVCHSVCFAKYPWKAWLAFDGVAVLDEAILTCSKMVKICYLLLQWFKGQKLKMNRTAWI